MFMNKTDKIREGQIQIGDKHNYRPLSQPMVKETHSKVLRLITDPHCENHIDDMKRKTPNLKHLNHNSKQNRFKPTVWKRYIDNIFSLWDISKPDIESRSVHRTSKLTSPNYKIHGRNI